MAPRRVADIPTPDMPEEPMVEPEAEPEPFDTAAAAGQYKPSHYGQSK